MQRSAPLPRSRQLEKTIPPVLRPIIRAYVLGYASSTVPRLLTLFLTHLSRRRKNIDEKPQDFFPLSFIRILKGGLEIQRFPTFCAALVGGSTFLEIPVRELVIRIAGNLSRRAQIRLTKWISTFIAAWYSIKLIQTKESEAFVEYEVFSSPTGAPIRRPIRFAGRTLDLTLFAVTRATDVVVGELWSQRKSLRLSNGKWNKLDDAISTLADPSIFATSCALIMWAWIYTPDRLPRAYNKWITSAAAVDARLLTALRRTRFGEMVYGVETGEAHVLQDMCKDYGWPVEYGDPVKSIPFPCEVVHMGTGKSCEYHALSRLIKSFWWAFSTYLPINLLLTLRKPSKSSVKHAFISSARSSAFLGSFIALYYYGICLTRSRLGPKILGTSTPACRRIDSGLCVGGGCALCGWSVMIENAGRRKELGLFVAPRALATIFPRRYLLENQWRETMAFAISAAVVFTALGENPKRVRGVFGKIMASVLVP